MSNQAPSNITQIATQVLISEKGHMKSKGQEILETKGLDAGGLLEHEHCFGLYPAHVPKHAAAAAVKKRLQKQLAEMGREGAQSCPPVRWQHMVDHTNLEVDTSAARRPVKSTLYLVEVRGEGRVRNVVGLKEDYKVSPLGGWDDDDKSQRDGAVNQCCWVEMPGIQCCHFPLNPFSHKSVPH